ncbi:MAG: sulfurtransferase TusA family protein [Pseudanabaenaceae cyanobacterium]|jgi:TusA-related sulfurtransferase
MNSADPTCPTGAAPVPSKPIAKSVDLRGVACPLSFVRAKLHLEKLQSGEVLEVWLDGGEPIEQVPHSLAAAGHQVQSISPKDEFFALVVEKA